MRTTIGAALGILFIATAHADDARISPRETINYLTKNYKTGGVRPELRLELKYNPPFLQVSWQRQIQPADGQAGRIDDERVSIDLRYARFNAWNDGRLERNAMVVDCWNHFPCYRDELRHRAYGDGRIDYFVSAYSSEPIATALNHLAFINEKSRPRGKFE